MSTVSSDTACSPGEHRPVALTIAGSDSGGGAGIQADLRAFAFFGVHGTTAITAITAQNPREVSGVLPLPPEFVRQQIDAVMAAFTVRVVKTGMLFNIDTIRTVADCLRERTAAGLQLVVDPVMVATSGAPLLQDEAVDTLCRELLPQATIITPNLPEAEVLAGRSLEDAEETARAGLELARKYDAIVVIKGGHREGRCAADTVAGLGSVLELTAPWVSAATSHGSGCSFSSAAAACLALGDETSLALRRAKAYVLASLRNCIVVGPGTGAMGIPAFLPLDDVEERQL